VLVDLGEADVLPARRKLDFVLRRPVLAVGEIHPVPQSGDVHVTLRIHGCTPPHHARCFAASFGARVETSGAVTLRLDPSDAGYDIVLEGVKVGRATVFGVVAREDTRVDLGTITLRP
jgi:hypothetical protein